MSFVKEFKEFAMRGNVVDLAVGIVIGAGFGKIVSSLVNDVIMPPIGLALGHTDFSGLFINLSGKTFETLKAAKEANAATINYGVFLNTVIEFIIVAFAVFLVVKVMNSFKKPEAAPPPPSTRECPYCTSAIALKASRCPCCTAEVKPAA